MAEINLNQQVVKFKTIVMYNLYFWGAWWFFYALVFTKNLNFPFYVGLINSIYITIPLFLLSLLLWPLAHKLQYYRVSQYYKVLIHLAGSNIYSVLWLSVYYGILFLIYGNELYTFFDVNLTIGWQYPSGITFYLMVSGAYYSLIYYREIKSREIKESRLELLLKETQFKALKSQLNPHFLFNSLNSINALITSEPHKARSMLVKLSDLLRLSLNTQKRAFVPLDSELEFAHTYLDIEKIRLGERLNYTENISVRVKDLEIPSMILQPLLENAVKHGIAPSNQKGFVELQLEMINSKLIINVINSIPLSFNEKRISDNSNNGIGLNNLEERLLTIYGNDVQFAFGKKENNCFRVNIKLPLQKTDI
jgi:sensor histidine kinase YesM